MDKVIAIIPARWGSTRLPGKPIADINGKSMIQWVYEAVEKSNVDKVVVAADNALIIETVKGFGGEAILTDIKHQTGTERVLEAYQHYNDKYNYVINVQGDEPFINKDDINTLIQVLKNDSTKIATLLGRLTPEQFKDRNTVKALFENERILMFTRSPLFYCSLFVRRHIGIYGFRIETSNEIVESLEQIRWGDNGIEFSYAFASGLYKGIDTPEDLDHVRTYLN